MKHQTPRKNLTKQEILEKGNVEKNKEALLSYAKREASFHSGPLPKPETLNGYELILEGSADRIISMAEKEQEFQHIRDLRNYNLSKKGINYGVFTFVLVLGLTAYSLYLENIIATCVLLAMVGFSKHCLGGLFFNREKEDKNPQQSNNILELSDKKEGNKIEDKS